MRIENEGKKPSMVISVKTKLTISEILAGHVPQQASHVATPLSCRIRACMSQCALDSYIVLGQCMDVNSIFVVACLAKLKN